MGARKGEIDAYVAEKEKVRKKKKVKDDGPIPIEHFSWLQHDMVAELLVERLKHPDCNAGAVFDNLKSRNYESELVAIKSIMEACTLPEIILVNMMDNKLRSELKESYVIEPRDIAEFRGVELPKDLFKPTQAELAAKTASMKNTQNMEGKKDEKKNDPKDKKGRGVRGSGSTRIKSAKNSNKNDKNKTAKESEFQAVNTDAVIDDQILDPNQLKDDVNLFEINEPKVLGEEEQI